ncbi:MAG TPA: RNA-binding S4 domain-containing protein [Bacteroidales bacterium]|jgi:ribosome-associated heat shock protein Hsp15|nr:RNA-binding S4 domain-containing protein [Bacteroidales bacterium]
MTGNSSVRIDKFLWSVRIFKTRSIAAEECRKGRILIGNLPVKPSRTISAGEVFSVKKLPVIYTYRVIELPETRKGASQVGNYIEDLTPSEEKEKLLLNKEGVFIFRKKGSGRPTKKDRRIIDRLKDNNILP